MEWTPRQDLTGEDVSPCLSDECLYTHGESLYQILKARYVRRRQSNGHDGNVQRMISRTIACLSRAENDFLPSAWLKYACSSSTLNPSAAALRSSSPSKLSSTSSASAGVRPACPWARRDIAAGVLGVRGRTSMLSSEVACARACMGSVLTAGASSFFVARRRGFCREELDEGDMQKKE